MIKRKLLVIVLSNLKHDARVRRQVHALTEKYEVHVACFDGETSAGYKLIRLKATKLTLLRKAVASAFLLFRIYPAAYKILHNYNKLIADLQGENYDVIIANDVETLPLAFGFPGNPKVIFDAHEYAPRHFEDKRTWRIFFQSFNVWLCRKYIKRTAAMMTVGKALANEYEKNFGVRPVVITNANNYVEINPSEVTENKIRLVHHGIATPSRQLEIMIDMMDLLDDRFSFDMILMVPPFASPTTRNYIDILKARAAKNPRIRISPPVSSSEVVKRIHEYDIGVFLIPPINFNYENTLPNKLFDFIQARLGIAIGPTPEMAEIVRKYKTGVVSDDFRSESLASKLSNLTKEDVEEFKKNSSVAAKELNADVNAEKVRKLVASVIAG